jgi:serine/threonine-protein kinase
MNGPQIIDDLQTTTICSPVDASKETRIDCTRTATAKIAGVDPESIKQEGRGNRQLGNYHLKGKLGAGGMGEVYEAEHLLLKRRCAIKFIRQKNTGDPDLVDQFEKEIQATARLTHWNTVDVFDCGRTDDGTLYYVMELLPGMSLADLVDRYGPLPPDRAVHFLRQICGALGEAHSLGLIHRDIKPGNVFASERGGCCDMAKLLDFGLVKEHQPEEHADTNAEGDGSFSGSPLFMSPEQADARDQEDARSDIYSLGAVAYFLLTGRPPFVKNGLSELITAHRREQPKRPSELKSDIPADVERVVRRCLAKDPGERFQDVESLEGALTACECADSWTKQRAAAWWQAVEADEIVPSGKSVIPSELP